MRRLTVLMVPLLAVGLASAASIPAQAGTRVTSSAARSSVPGAALGQDGSSGSQTEGSGNCVAYANGTGMGSFCASAGSSTIGTLRQRFGGQDFQSCRYGVRDDSGKLVRRVPKGIHTPHNPSPQKGTWWLRTCLTNIDWDTISGGTDRRLSLQVVWMDHDADKGYDETPLSRFLWQQVAATTQFPVPFLRTRPSFTPLVGVPAFFTFRWTDPEDNSAQPLVQYPGSDVEGPYVETVNSGGLTMRARVRNTEINPRQEGMDPVDCGPGSPTYDGDAGPYPSRQQNGCHITFDRSSATAPETSTAKVPKGLGDVYYLRIGVTWEVEYKHDGDDEWTQLGDGFEMVSMQPLPVQEVQAPNVPPVMIF